MADIIRIAVVDADPLYRKGLVETISSPRLVVVAEGETADEVRGIVQQFKPDILILDISVSGDGIGAAENALRMRSSLKVIVLTSLGDEEDVGGALEAGIQGYILKGVRGPELVSAIEDVHLGKPYITPALGSRLLVQTRGRPLGATDGTANIGLTVHDKRVLRNLARGLSNRELASELGVPVRTVKYYLSRIFRKMQVSSRFQAILAAKRMRLDLTDRGHSQESVGGGALSKKLK